MGKGLFKAAAIMIFSLFVVSCCHGNKQINLNAYKTKTVKAKDATMYITVKGDGSEELTFTTGEYLFRIESVIKNKRPVYVNFEKGVLKSTLEQREKILNELLN